MPSPRDRVGTAGTRSAPVYDRPPPALPVRGLVPYGLSAYGVTRGSGGTRRHGATRVTRSPGGAWRLGATRPCRRARVPVTGQGGSAPARPRPREKCRSPPSS
ncbi:hypothetical protein GCM10018785_57730 [Streptomyces longispororuber]|uniref:Uncharacterized protein n=1 Tax=Streptomyces longispororuber TaxID=68230 RepID=A0A919A0E0_9ACTN|nr:hypothetical protein GCM10018785_57730 [Streptomyces longispororuber]